MKINVRIAVCSAALGVLILPAADQQDRIANGVASGELTARETGKLEKKESNLNREEKLMRSEDHGKLTGADRKVLNQQQNQLSKQIYNQKHDGQTQ